MACVQQQQQQKWCNAQNRLQYIWTLVAAGDLIFLCIFFHQRFWLFLHLFTSAFLGRDCFIVLHFLGNIPKFGVKFISMQLLQYQLCYWTFFKKRISQKNLSKWISFSWPHAWSTLADSFSLSQQASRPTRWLCILQNTKTKIVSLDWSPSTFLQLFCNACIHLYQPSGVSTGWDKDKRFRTEDNAQMDSQFEHNLTMCLCQLLLFGAPHVSMAGLRKGYIHFYC